MRTWDGLDEEKITMDVINNHFKSQLKIHLNNIIRVLHKPLAFSFFHTPLLN